MGRRTMRCVLRAIGTEHVAWWPSENWLCAYARSRRSDRGIESLRGRIFHPETGRGVLLALRDPIPLSPEEPQGGMKFVCDAPGGKAWFRLETDSEAAAESMLMHHAVEKYFRQEKERAMQSYHPTSKVFVEQEIGLKAHLERRMAMFLTLRDAEGVGLATAMLPPGGRDDLSFKMIIVGPNNSDPYPDHGDAIRALGRKFGIALERSRCFPYHRS